MPIRYYDTHCHLASMHRKDPNLISATKEALSFGQLANGIDVGIDPDDLEHRLPLIAETGISWYSAGIYPSYAGDDAVDTMLSGLEKRLAGVSKNRDSKDSPRLVALGEIGIDFYHDYGTETQQRYLFEAQVAIANTYKLPIIVHNRDADAALFQAVKNTRPEAGGVLHCFSSTYEIARKFLDFGFFISFAGNVTYKTADAIREAARQVPANRILVETDSPYLSPVPLRGKPNQPANVAFTYTCLAEVRKVAMEDLSHQIEQNVYDFVRADYRA